MYIFDYHLTAKAVITEFSINLCRTLYFKNTNNTHYTLLISKSAKCKTLSTNYTIRITKNTCSKVPIGTQKQVFFY